MTLCVVVMAATSYRRFKKYGDPIQFGTLKAFTGIGLVFWSGAALAEFYLNPSNLAAGAAAFSAGVTLTVFFMWVLNAAVDKIERERESLRELSSKDAVTGLWNRRVFHEYVKDEFAKSLESNIPLSLMMVEIDGMSELTRQHGLKAVDLILRETGSRLYQFVRDIDFVFRYSENILALVLPQMDRDSMLALGHRIKAHAREVPMDIQDGKSISVTLSMGIASSPEHSAGDASLRDAALEALERARKSGGDRVYVSKGQGEYQVGAAPLSRKEQRLRMRKERGSNPVPGQDEKSDDAASKNKA